MPWDGVRTREDLAAHIDGLLADHRERGEEWENATLGDFLEALAACVRGSPGWYPNAGREVPADGDWAFFARVLDSATGYE
ncbi:hypothetical protein KSNIM_14515 [Kitasatospora sp. DSM 101779]|nr:hypothetical protein [Kitasatospora sp. DSM 101779]